MKEHNFSDHNHTGQFGPPYVHNKPISCVKCIEEILAYRADLCEKYGWDAWPEDISVVQLTP